MFKVPKQAYTAEFKAAVVQRIKDGQGFAVVARELGMSEQTLRNWVKADESGKLNGAGAKPVTPEQMELSPETLGRRKTEGSSNTATPSAA
ncbi:transposase family protein [Burkholderia pseudomallei MSHR3458]|nr:transposase family protein [Burkholderia pseudomallei MSHR2243]AIV72424.1 transposase family protein [Burkholderia pseudomallei MSHR62]KGU66771.1 transposase family protein [Burkholderia pseudomallei MSHR465J]KGW70676.1 transposase family protein [Burkholderia pseudomallei MSHR3458]KGX48018.1 transposase family protein [Burkholderia pseudomallei MSHR2138]